MFWLLPKKNLVLTMELVVYWTTFHYQKEQFFCIRKRDRQSAGDALVSNCIQNRLYMDAKYFCWRTPASWCVQKCKARISPWALRNCWIRSNHVLPKMKSSHVGLYAALFTVLCQKCLCCPRQRKMRFLNISWLLLLLFLSFSLTFE